MELCRVSVNDLFSLQLSQKERKKCGIHSLKTPCSPPRCATAGKPLNFSELVSSFVKQECLLDRGTVRTEKTRNVQSIQQM